MIFTAQPETLPFLWPHALPHLERFCKEVALLDTEQLYRDVMENQKQLWMVEEDGQVTTIGLTEIWRSDAGPVCTIRVAAGNCGTEALRNACKEIEAWAVSIGCVEIEVWGRKGWSRVLDGYRQTGVILGKDLRQVH